MPKHPSLPFSGRGQHQSPAQALQRAVFALQVGQFAEAEQLAAEVLKSNRTDAMAVSVLARALLAQNRGADAIAPLEKAVRRHGDAGLETLLGAALGSARRPAEAIDMLRKTTERRPPFLPAFQELAGQLARLGRFEEGIAVIESGLALRPGSIDLQLDLARLHGSRNQRARARAILSTLRQAAPERADIMAELARILLLDGEYAAAADTYRQILALRPDDPMVRADLAACLLEMGDRDAGEANLRLALRGRPQMLGRAAHALVASSHGRFFFRPSAAANYLQSGPA